MKRLLNLFTFIILTYVASAQSGTLEGKIKDKATGEEIIGASVYLKGTTIGASSDFDGNYRITNIPPGTYTIIASFISYQQVEFENVSIEKNKSTYIKIELDEASEQLDDIVVVAKRKTDTEMSMISSIRNSNLVMSGVSKQQIERSPDKDAAEIVRRVPGITIIDNRFIIVRGLDKRYNTVWVNGATTPSSESDARAFSFDAIPSGMLSRLCIFKTPAPELPADFAGANVMIETKGVPDKEELQISLSTGINQGTSFNQFYNYEGGNLDWLGFDDGTRDLPSVWPSTKEYEELRGSIDAEGWDKITEWSKAFNKNWTANSIESARPDMGVSMASAKRFDLKKPHRSIGNITSISYSNSNDHTQYFKSRYESYDTILDRPDTMLYTIDDVYLNKVKIGIMHNWSFELSPDHALEFRNLYNHIGKIQTILREGKDFYHSELPNKGQEFSFMGRNTYSGQLAGKHKFTDGTTQFDWILGYSYADKDQPDIRRIRWNQIINDESVHNLDYALIINNMPTPSENGRLFMNMYEHIWVFGANFSKDFNFNSFRPQLKAGVFYEKKNREFSIRNIGIVKSIYPEYNNEIVYMPIDSVFMDENIDSRSGILYGENTQAKDAYKAESELIAGYIALKIPITSLLNVYGGVRFEKNKQLLTGFQDEVDPNTPNPYIEPDITIDTINFFPSVNVAYNVGEKSVLRFAYGLTINRPEFRELSPFAFYDFEKTATVYGNDTLKNAYIHNFDLRYEWYPTPSEIITIGAFYKNFIDPIELNLFPASNGWDFVAKNTDKATSLGLEIDAKKSFAVWGDRTGFLRRLKNFSLSLNAAWIKSEVRGSDAYLRDKVRPMQGQSPYIVNTGLYYQNEETKWMFSLLYNVIGERIVYVGTSENPHTYEMPHNLIDLSVSKQIGEHVKLKAAVKDLLNEEITYNQTYEFNQDTDGDGIGDGIVERKQLIQAYNPGRLFNFSITYRF
ncbi:MAG: TonB-dependent receptor [Bacteroidales bacterium]|nr:TonB-dependent receptor [Bacteroidales bacterium]MCF8455735.1 TonB-dependent receptor [Bacteroidales bacterium]